NLCDITAKLAILTVIFTPFPASAEDRRTVIPENEAVFVVEAVPTGQIALTYATKLGESDASRLFREAGDAEVSSTFEDLNGDGRAEIIAVLSGTTTCGAAHA